MASGSSFAGIKILEAAGFVSGIAAMTWAIIPVNGSSAIWLAVPGLAAGITAIVLSGKKGYTRKRFMITGIALNAAAICLSFYWYSQIASNEIQNTHLTDSLNIH